MAMFKQKPTNEAAPFKERRVKGKDIHFRAGQVEGERVCRGRAEPRGLALQGPPQVGQRDAQAGPRLALRAVRPEGGGQPVALNLLAGAKHEQCQQPLASPTAQAWQRNAVALGRERPEQGERQRWWRVSHYCGGKDRLWVFTVLLPAR